MPRRNRFLPILFCALLACGKPTSVDPPDGGAEPPTDASEPDLSGTNGSTTSPDSGGGGACEDIAARFMDAVRAIPRDCVTDADCKILPRAQSCDCDLAVSAASDTAAYDAVRAEADAEQCENPFGCATGECPYRRLSTTGEIYGHCTEEGQCETLQIMSCTEYEARAQGGIANPGGCEVDTDCQLRNDLNPCDCAEGVTTNFPFLATSAIYELIQINDQRCGEVSCGPCEIAEMAVCATDADGTKYCSAN